MNSMKTITVIAIAISALAVLVSGCTLGIIYLVDRWSRRRFWNQLGKRLAGPNPKAPPAAEPSGKVIVTLLQGDTMNQNMDYFPAEAISKSYHGHLLVDHQNRIVARSPSIPIEAYQAVRDGDPDYCRMTCPRGSEGGSCGCSGPARCWLSEDEVARLREVGRERLRAARKLAERGDL